MPQTVNIPNRVIQIDSRFARIISSVSDNKYNPGHLYEIANRFYGTDARRGNAEKQQQQTPGVWPIRPKLEDVKRRDAFNKSVTGGVQRSKRLRDNLTSVYTGKSNSKNYVRYIDTPTLQRISHQALSNYNSVISVSNHSVYNGDKNSSPYQPVRVPFNPSDFVNALRSVSQGKYTFGGLAQYYFGGMMRIGRTVSQSSKVGSFNRQLAAFVAYNTFRGTFLNMTPTPLRSTLGFDIPLIGPLAINTIGAYGVGRVKSEYKNDSGLKSGDMHTFTSPKQALPGRSSALADLEKDVLGTGTDNINGFYDTIGQIRRGGLRLGLTKGFQKRQPASSNNLANRLLNKFFKKRRDGFKSSGGKNVYYDGTMGRSNKYKKSVFNKQQLTDFYSQVDISSPNVILIKLTHEHTLPELKDNIGNVLVLPAALRSISDNDSVQWQDTWNNTGRFQPIKAYLSTARNVQMTFSVFAFTLFNDVNAQRFKSETKNALDPASYNRNRYNLASNDMNSRIRSANKQYKLTMSWLKQLAYPVMDQNSVKRYNVRTSLTLGEFITQQSVVVNSVNAVPNRQFYWTYKFPMLIDVSMSFTVFRNVDRGGKPKGLMYDIRTRTEKKYNHPGIPSATDPTPFVNQTPLQRAIVEKNRPDSTTLIGSKPLV